MSRRRGGLSRVAGKDAPIAASPARLHRIERGLELCWLALALLTPSLFNPASLRVFEAEKVAFVRAVALLMAALWAAELLLGSKARYADDVSGGAGRASWIDRLRAFPFLLPVAALMGCYLLAALLSDLPQVSLMGSYRRQFGAATHLSCAVVFLAAAAHLRTPARGRRLVLAIALGASIPSLYALIQRFGLDPIPWGIDNSRRVVGTLGQPTFLGAYLAAAIPSTVWLVLGAGARRARFGLALLLAIQLLALLFSQSRAAWLGAAVGGSLVLLRSDPGRRLVGRIGLRRLALAGAAALTLLVAINLPGSG
ncbi:MAG TPA: hypothetical protein VHS28_05670, partial [Chloroflexota bacterium]|nr:hypothetical protein [Chloroflexota bacterium]